MLDTQGMFDNKTSIEECAAIFALSTMISSVQVYNVSLIIEETHLEYLQVFFLQSNYFQSYDNQSYHLFGKVVHRVRSIGIRSFW